MSDSITRRTFLKGSVASAAFMAGLFTPFPFKQLNVSANSSDDPILVVVSLRGGWDALNVVAPISGEDVGYYQKARPTLQIPQKELLPLETRFGVHPALKPLFELYQDQKMAVVHAVGLTYNTRSHFEAVEYMELGTPGEKTIHSGWLSRAWLADAFASEEGIPLVAIPSQPTALQGSNQTISLSSFNDLQLWDGGMIDAQIPVLRQLYAGESNLAQSTNRTLDVLELVKSRVDQEYKPAGGVKYQDDEFSRNLQAVAQLIKMNTNLRYATIDYGGWDTHEDQNYGTEGEMGILLSNLAAGLSSFYRDIEREHARRVTVVVMSEFGRRLAQNESRGTDHGHGGVMLVLGGQVLGGKVYGKWPGLANEQLFERSDLAVTTDYRQVMSEILQKPMQIPNIIQVFPGFQMQGNLGLFG